MSWLRNSLCEPHYSNIPRGMGRHVETFLSCLAILLVLALNNAWADDEKVGSSASSPLYDEALKAIKTSGSRGKQPWVMDALEAEANAGNAEAMFWYGISLIPRQVKSMPTSACIWIRNAARLGYLDYLAFTLNCDLTEKQIAELQNIASANNKYMRYYTLSRWKMDALQLTTKYEDQLFKPVLELARQGDHLAQYQAYVAYEYGMGRVPDKTEAAFWYLQARFNPKPEQWRSFDKAPAQVTSFRVFPLRRSEPSPVNLVKLSDKLIATASSGNISAARALEWFEDKLWSADNEVWQAKFNS